MTIEEIQNLVLENEELRGQIASLEFKVQSLERGCACYRNSQKNLSERKKED
jgi:exonuclease VII small subunit